MENDEKYPYFQELRSKISVPATAFLTSFLFLLAPTHPFKGGSSHWVELADGLNGKDVHKLFKIYSVLKQHKTRATDGSVWTIAKTILDESKRHSIDPMLVLAIIKVESRFSETAVSHRGARGLMQLRPFVASALVEEVNAEGWEGEKSLDDPILNIKLGVYYLRNLKKDFGDLKLALSAYNWGPTEIRNRLDEERNVPLDYAMRVLSTYHYYRSSLLPRP